MEVREIETERQCFDESGILMRYWVLDAQGNIVEYFRSKQEAWLFVDSNTKKQQDKAKLVEENNNNRAIVAMPGESSFETTAKRRGGKWLIGGDVTAAYPKGTTFLIRCKDKATQRWAWYKLQGMMLVFQDYTGEN
jgi:hypothetical protein